MIEPKARRARVREEDYQLPPEEIAAMEQIIKDYAPLLRALSKY
jgi:hypothetical protein